MSKKNFWIAIAIYTVVFVLPPLAYLLGNFYTYLFDGWQLSRKFADAALWVTVAACGYGFLAIWYTGLKDE